MRDRGATLVEYALVLALFVTVIVGGLEVITNEAGDEFTASSHSIGEPAPPPVPNATSTTLQVTTTVPPTTTTVPPTTTTVPPTTTTTKPVTFGSATCDRSNCSLQLSDLPPGASVSWAILPAVPNSGGNPLSVRFPNEPGTGFWNLSPTTTVYTVTATVQPGGQRVSRTLTCSGNWLDTRCSS